MIERDYQLIADDLRASLFRIKQGSSPSAENVVLG